VEGLRFARSGEGRRSFRGRVVLLVILPTAFLGAASLLFNEYVLDRAGPGTDALRLTLRLGEAGLFVLALILAAACGYLLADRVSRPIRLLLRLAEEGEITAPRAAFLERRGREVYQLYRLVSVLTNQNKAGARALEELESLRRSLASLREVVTRTGQHGVLQPVITKPGGPVAEIGASLEAKRLQLLGFFGELRERVRAVRAEVEAFPPEDESPDRPAAVSEEPAAVRNGEALEQAKASVERLRQLGTVLVLEAGRSGASEGDHVNDLLGRFRGGLDDLEAWLRNLGASGAGNGGSPPSGEGTEQVSPEEGVAFAAGPDDESSPQPADRQARLRAALEGLEALERRLGEVESK